jgi:oxaloacetate decarboxylase gamma subunit
MMQEIHIMGESIKFMVLGMMVVYVFLIVLIQLMKLQAKIIGKYFPEKVIVAPVKQQPVVQSDDDAKRTAAIIAAIAEFKKSKS